MKTMIASEEMYEKIKSCMDNDFYEQTVKEQGGEPKTPEERRSFVMAYLHNDRIDRNGEARAAYRAEHEIPPLSLMTSDPIEYDRQEHDFHNKFPIKTFTDVVKEQTGITIKADLTDRMYFYIGDEDEPMQEKASSGKRISVEDQLRKSAGERTQRYESERPQKVNAHNMSNIQAEL